MNKYSLGLSALVLAASSSAYAQQEPSMKEQAKQDWQEIRNTAGEAAAGTAEWGKSVGHKAADLGREAAEQGKELGKKAKQKADELTTKARDAAQGEEPSQAKEPAGKRFFY